MDRNPDLPAETPAGQTTPADRPAAAPPDEPTRALIGWLRDGHADLDADEALRAQFPAADHRAAWQRAADYFAAAAQISPQHLAGYLTTAYIELYRRALAADDFRSALSALTALAKLPRSDHNEEEPLAPPPAG